MTEHHIKQHRVFVDDFNKIISDKNLDAKHKSSELLHRLLDWYADHIVTSDKQLANFLLKHKIE